MPPSHPLAGVHAAALTPLTPAGEPDTDAVPRLLRFLAERGCHGALLLGTTGEGPSFSPAERRAIWEAAQDVRTDFPAFRLMAGTGTPSLTETIELTRAAFDLGFDAAVVLPPYYYRNASQDGLYDWFARLMDEVVPEGRYLLGYHIPPVSGVPLPLTLLQRLGAAHPGRFAGLKDSSGDPAQARAYAEGLPGGVVLVGNDHLMAGGLASGASGCITSGANLWSPQLRAIWDAHWGDRRQRQETTSLQRALDPARRALDAHPPAPALLKALLHELHGFSRWPVRPPLLDFTPEQTRAALAAYQAALT